MKTVKLREVMNLLEVTQLSLISRSMEKPVQLRALLSPDQSEKIIIILGQRSIICIPNIIYSRLSEQLKMEP